MQGRNIPLSRYNSRFGGKPGSAAKALKAMGNTYGKKKAKGVFYALLNKRKKQ